MNSEVQLYSQFTDPLAAIERCGNIIAKSGFAGCDRAEQGQAIMLFCMSEKRTPTDLLRNFDIVQGRLRKKALAMLADFRQRGGRHTWIATGDDGKAAELKLSFEGAEITVRVTMEDATRQGLVKAGSAWIKTPGNMLRARCISNGVAMLCPEIVAGSEDEAEGSPAQVAPLNLGGSVSVSSPAVSAPIEIPVQVMRSEPPQDRPALELAGLAPVSAPVEPVKVPEPAPVVPVPIQAANPGGIITPAQMQQLEEIVGPHFDKAMAWFVKEKWLAEGDSILRLTEKRAARVIQQSKSWLRAIGATEGAAK